MEAFTFTYPTKVYFGHGVAAQALWQELAKVGRTVMLAYGGGSVKRSGVYDELKGLLLEAGKEVVDFPGIQPNPTYAKAQAGAALAQERGVDFVLAVGGGSVIDCCKVICAQAVLAEDLWKMEYERGAFPSAGLPMGAVVTASGTGAEMNSGAVITCEDKLWKGPIVGTAASFAILDPAYTATVPRMQVLSGAFDTLSHAMETYLGASDADNVSDDVALAIQRNTVTNIRRLLENIDDMQARGNLMWDSAMAENGILKAGRRTDFQAHQIEHQLGAHTDCNHGQGLAVIQPRVLPPHPPLCAGEVHALCAGGVRTPDRAGGPAGADGVRPGVRPAHTAQPARLQGGDHAQAAPPRRGHLQRDPHRPVRVEPGRDL